MMFKKAMIVSAFLMVPMAHADNLEVSLTLRAVEIKEVKVEREEGGRGAVWKVTAIGKFSNKCHIPRTEEIGKEISWDKTEDVMTIRVLSFINRPCTEEFNPQEVTLDLGTYTHPSDGIISAFIVNSTKADTRPKP